MDCELGFPIRATFPRRYAPPNEQQVECKIERLIANGKLRVENARNERERARKMNEDSTEDDSSTEDEKPNVKKREKSEKKNSAEALYGRYVTFHYECECDKPRPRTAKKTQSEH